MSFRIIPPVTLGRFNVIVSKSASQSNSTSQSNSADVNDSSNESLPSPSRSVLQHSQPHREDNSSEEELTPPPADSPLPPGLQATIQNDDRKKRSKRTASIGPSQVYTDLDPNLKNLAAKKLQLQITALETEKEFNLRMRPLEIQLKEAQIQLAIAEKEAKVAEKKLREEQRILTVLQIQDLIYLSSNCYIVIGGHKAVKIVKESNLFGFCS